MIQSKEPNKFALGKDSKFRYASGSDVMATWKKYGFIPPTETRCDFLFSKNREKPNE